MLDEIVLPITEPETEWVRDRPLQKMSPRRDHARIQGLLFSAFDPWSQGRGEVGTEWRFRVLVPGGPRRPLVPDVAYVEYAALRDLSDEDIQAPALAPTVAIEVLSPGDDRRDVEDKIATYLAAGTKLVIVIDPKQRTAELHDPSDVRRLTAADTLLHPALPEFHLALGPFFERALARG